MNPAVDALQLALNGWVGVSTWTVTDMGWRRVVIHCQRVDGNYSARVQEAPKA
jgi:hypothetical protein